MLGRFLFAAFALLLPTICDVIALSSNAAAFSIPPDYILANPSSTPTLTLLLRSVTSTKTATVKCAACADQIRTAPILSIQVS